MNQNPNDNETVALFACNAATRTKLLELRERTGLSNNQLARKIGCSPSIISQWLAPEGNKYTGDIARWERSAEDFIRNDARRRSSGVETTDCDVATQMRSAFELIRKTNDVGLLLAESGYGKTRGLELYQAQNPTVIVFQVRSWAADKGSVEGVLFEAIGRAGYDGRTKRATFMSMKLTGSDRLLIVDDAHKLTRPALQWLFDFTDETQTPLALVGTFELEDKVADDAQRFSRIGLRVELVPTNVRDLIKHLIKSHAPGLSAGQSDLVDLCEQVANEHGHFRAVHKQLKLMAELKEHSEKSVTWQEAFRQAHTQMVRRYKLA